MSAKAISSNKTFTTFAEARGDVEGFDLVVDANGGGIGESFAAVAPGCNYILHRVVKCDAAFSDPATNMLKMSLLGSRNALQAYSDRVIALILTGGNFAGALSSMETALNKLQSQIEAQVGDRGAFIKSNVTLGT